MLHTFDDTWGRTYLILDTEEHPVDPDFLSNRTLLTAPDVRPWTYYPYDAIPSIIWPIEPERSLYARMTTDPPPDAHAVVDATLAFTEILDAPTRLGIDPSRIHWDPRFLFVSDDAHPIRLSFIVFPRLTDPPVTWDPDTTCAWLTDCLIRAFADIPEVRETLRGLRPPVRADELRALLARARIPKGRSPRILRVLRRFRRPTLPALRPRRTPHTAPRRRRRPNLPRLPLKPALLLGHLAVFAWIFGVLTSAAGSLTALTDPATLRRLPTLLNPTHRLGLILVLALLILVDLGLILLLRRAARTDSAPHAGPPDTAEPARATDSPQTPDTSDAPAPAETHTTALARLTPDGRSLRRSTLRGMNAEGAAFISDIDYYIGRDPNAADLVIGDTRISALHARICQREGFFYFTDLSETGGCTLEGRRMIRYDEYLLPDTARLGIGPLRLRFERIT